VLNDLSEPIPDLSILRWRADDYLDAHPTPEDVFLVIEVAGSSITLDREHKLPAYAKAGIPEYWIINIPAKKVEVYRNPLGDTYQDMQLRDVNGSVELTRFNLVLKVQDLFK
jgi:Uma2 family endonuclease